MLTETSYITNKVFI